MVHRHSEICAAVTGLLFILFFLTGTTFCPVKAINQFHSSRGVTLLQVLAHADSRSLTAGEQLWRCCKLSQPLEDGAPWSSSSSSSPSQSSREQQPLEEEGEHGLFLLDKPAEWDFALRWTPKPDSLLLLLLLLRRRWGAFTDRGTAFFFFFQ